jgi:hypothetical protein
MRIQVQDVWQHIRSLTAAVVLISSVSAWSPAAAAELVVERGQNLQVVLDMAMPGDVITLEAGATFVGDFILRAKPGSEFITVRSSAPASSLPAAGQRTGPAYAPMLPKLQAASGPVLLTADGAHHWRFENVEFLANPNRGTAIVVLGAMDNHQTSVSLLPHNIVFDRIYMHDDAGGSKRGIQTNSAATQIVNSYIVGIRREGQESQAIGGWNGPGPFLIENNYIEAAGIGIMFGGADPDIPNLIASDITVRRNHVTKSLSWRSENWTIKNALELKNAQRVLIDGNVFENSWAQAQAGYLVLFTSVNDGGRCTWCTVRNVTFTNNIVRHGNAGLQITGRSSYSGMLSTIGSNIVVRNNLFYDINTRWGSGIAPLGRFALIGAEMAQVTIDHNTIDNDGPMAIALGSYVNGAYEQLPGLTITNNILRGNVYGLRGDSSGSGTQALQDFARNGYTFLHNVLASDDYPAAGGSYPASTSIPSVATFEGSFVDKGAQNYRLVASSAYKNAATDGTDIGVNMDALGGAFSKPDSTAAPPAAPTNVRIVLQ